MPHYPTQLDEFGDDQYAVYSTIVDNTISEDMTGSEMREHLEAKGMTHWLKPYDPEAVYAEYGRDDPRMLDLFRDQEKYIYWDEELGFSYVKLSDCYFTLPPEDWRFE